MVAFYYNTNSCLLYLGGGIYVYDLRDQLFFYAIFSKGKYLRSFIFALLYTLAPYRLYLGPASFVVGEYIASTFIPLAFLGFYHIVCGDKRKWYWLTIGMTLLAYSHILSILLISEIFTILLLVAFFKGDLDLKRAKYLLISAGVTVILVLPVIIPLVTDYFGRE